MGACRNPSEPPAVVSEVSIGVPESNVTTAQLGARELVTSFTAEGLTQLTADGRVAPRLAERWAWENNGLTLRVFLRQNVKLHDGRRFDAAIATQLIREAVARPSNRRSYPSFADIAQTRAAAQFEVAIDLLRPSALILEDMEVLLNVGPAGVSTGPYRVVKEDTSELVLERFPDYYLGVPSIQRVIIKPFDTLRTAWSSLLRGDVDMVTDVPADAVEFIRNTNIQVASYPRRYQYVVAFNSRKAPFDSPVVRQALNAAVDRDAIVKRVLQGHGIASTGPLWPQHWAYDGSIQSYNFDRALAASLLDSAGHRIGSAPQPPGFPPARLRFTCLLPANFTVIERLALELQRQLYEVGVDVEFQPLTPAEYTERMLNGNFEATLVDMISGPTLARPFIFWRSAAGFKGLNVFGYENAEAERLFQLLKTTTNEAAIRSTARQMQHVFLEDPPAIFLAWNERTRGITRDLRVYQEPGRDPLITLWRWTAAANVQAASVQ